MYQQRRTSYFQSLINLNKNNNPNYIFKNPNNTGLTRANTTI